MFVFQGCRSSGDPAGDEATLPPISLARGTVQVLSEGTERPECLGFVARVTYDAAVVVAVPPRTLREPLRLVIPGEPPIEATVLARRPDALVLAIPRAGRDLRPLELAPEPPSGLAPVQFLSLEAAQRPSIGPRGALIAADPPPGQARGGALAWLAAAPRFTDQDERPSEARAEAAAGGLVLDRSGRLVGLVGQPDDSCPRIVLASALASRLGAAIQLPPGADHVRPGDGLLVYRLRVESTSDLPRCEDDLGSGPMLALEVRLGGELAGRVEVTPGRTRDETTLVARAPGPLSVTLVALDRSLARGETRLELAPPWEAAAAAVSLDATFAIGAATYDAYPRAASGPRVARARLAFVPVDPDRNSARRTPSAATAITLGRATEGRVDLENGEADDFYALASPRAEGVVAVLYRRRLGSRLELRAFAPNFEGDTVALETEVLAPRVVVKLGRVLAGRAFVRVRQVSGTAGTGYELLLVPRGDAAGLVSALFRMVGRESAREETAFLDSDAFCEEVGEALSAAALPQAALSQAILDELGEPGSRAIVVRRLAFFLLERSFQPPPALLREVLARGGPGSDDAGLILAELEPRDAAHRPLLRRACNDPDSCVRARAVRAAARGGDAAFAEELSERLANDPSPVVSRAVAAARAGAAQLRRAGGVPSRER